MFSGIITAPTFASGSYAALSYVGERGWNC